MRIKFKSNISKILNYIILVGIFIICIITIVITMFTYNITPSEPLGLYVKIPYKEPTINDYIRLEIKDEYKKYLEESIGELPSYFIKNISAKSGDHVIMKGRDILINGKKVATRFNLNNFKNPEIDTILKDDEYICISKYPYSFDSRYIGIIKKDEIVGVYKYTHIFETKDIKNFNQKIFGNDY